jgi:hypothetical protein
MNIAHHRGESLRARDKWHNLDVVWSHVNVAVRFKRGSPRLVDSRTDQRLGAQYVYVAQELIDKWICGPVVNFLRRADLLNSRAPLPGRALQK